MRLAQLALERNVRSVLLDLSTGYHAATWHAILPALRKSGYKLGVHLPPAATLDGACDFATTERMSQAAFLDAAASTLAVPASRTLIVHPNAGEHIAMVGLDTSTAVPFPTPDTLVQDLLGFQHCLDPLYRAFGPYPIRFSEVFYESALSVALVNLKPIVPGHILVIPTRRIARFTHLDADEVADLWQSAQHIAKRLEPHYNAPAFTFSMQDGTAAGQTVPHVHVHVLPRTPGDFKKNDDIYDEARRQKDASQSLIHKWLV